MVQRKHFYADFTQEPIPVHYADGGIAVATAADNQLDFVRLSRGDVMRWDQVAANSELNFVAAGVKGWTIPGDNTANEGIEINPGCDPTGVGGNGGACQFTIGTDAAFFIRMVYETGTLANCLIAKCGFRLQAAHADITTAASVLSAYNDLACIGAENATPEIYTNTSVGATDAATNLTIANPGANDFVALEVDVSAAGAVTYKVGVSAVAGAAGIAAALAALAADASAVAYSFTSAIVVVPFVHFTCAGGAAILDQTIARLEVGYQK